MKTLFDLKSKNSEHVPTAEKVDLPEELLRKELHLPELNEVDVIRHFMDLSKKNYGVDNGFYPLGSCTMKYNPKINEDMARLNGFANLPPLPPESAVQGSLQLMHELETYLCEITGMDAFSLHPAAGAHGELSCLMIAKKHFQGKRHSVVLPDSAHGTNPASAAMCGFNVVKVKTDARGNVDLNELKKAMNDDVAVFMLTHPSTLGLFDENIDKIAKIVHDAGALMYCDGANMNAMLGITRPGDQGFDMIHINLHKTFSTPHCGGGPGSGPVGVTKKLVPYLPVSRVIKRADGTCALNYDYPDSIGYIASFYGNFGIILRAYAYILLLGKEGLKETTDHAVLNANYIRERLKDHFELAYDRLCMHEAVFSASRQAKRGVHALDIAKFLIDEGIHPPTVYFPLTVKESIMIETTESESKQTIDHFIDVMLKIDELSKTQPESVTDRPRSTPVSRPDEVKAARDVNTNYFGKG